MTDACETGYAVMKGDLTTDEVRSIATWNERWRFRRGDAKQVAPRSLALGGADVLTDPRTVLPLVKGEVLGEVELDPEFPELPESCLDPDRWHLLWAAPLDGDDAIHRKEMHGVLGAVKHCSRDKEKHGGRELIINDNLGDILSVSRFRAKDYKLLRFVQKIAAESLASGIRFYFRWVVSEKNVADGPSRLWQAVKHRDKGSQPASNLRPWSEEFDPLKIGEDECDSEGAKEEEVCGEAAVFES